MFISHKSNVIQQVHETEWQCRRKTKKMDLPEYWAWLESVTTEGVPDFSSEDYEIVETDAPLSYQDEEGNTISFNQSGHIHLDLDGTHYHLTWDGSAITPDDTALTECQTAEKWKRVRADRNRKLAETDYLALNDQNLSAEMTTYRQALRDITTQTDPDNITWPEKP